MKEKGERKIERGREKEPWSLWKKIVVAVIAIAIIVIVAALVAKFLFSVELLNPSMFSMGLGSSLAKASVNTGNIPKPVIAQTCLTYEDRGYGAAILKEGSRFWNDSDEDSVAGIDSTGFGSASSVRLLVRPLLRRTLRFGIGRLPAGLETDCIGNGLIDCGTGFCVNISSDPQNCGACGNRCGSIQTCMNGNCALITTVLPGYGVT